MDVPKIVTPFDVLMVLVKEDFSIIAIHGQTKLCHKQTELYVIDQEWINLNIERKLIHKSVREYKLTKSGRLMVQDEYAIELFDSLRKEIRRINNQGQECVETMKRLVKKLERTVFGITEQRRQRAKLSVRRAIAAR